MYSEHIQKTAQAFAENMKNSRIPIYGKHVRLPDRRAIVEMIDDLRRLMFPAYFGKKDMMSLSPEDYSALLLEKVEKELQTQITLALPEGQENKAAVISAAVIEQLPEIQNKLLKDLEALFDGDPAAQNYDEIIFAYPGLYAIFIYRVAHAIYQQKVPTIPRIMSEHAHSRTGIDIHPGANIGEYFFIDHGTGVVVGETTDIGDHVKLYQGVTLGALSPRAGHSSLPGKRHPTVESNTTIYSGASILGGKTIIGEGSVIGGNAFLTKSVSSGTRVVIQAPDTIFKRSDSSKDQA